MADLTKPGAKYTLMAHNNRYLIIKKSEGGSAHAVCECYLEQTAAQIRQLLTDAADADLENAHKGE